ncbi:bifunctional lysylphosphatidylglycerol flippase/synthetase MprF [Corynebacterium striatum]
MSTLKKFKFFPVTAALIAVMWALHLLDYEWVVTSGLSTVTIGGSIVVTFYALVFGIPTEKVLGSKKYFVVGLLAQMVSAPLALVIARGIEIADLNRWGDNLLHNFLFTPVGWIFGAAMYASAIMPRLWKRRFRVLIMVLALTNVFYAGSLADVLGLTAALLGFFLGMWRHPQPRATPSLRERRVLVALILGAVAISPVLVAINPIAEGPFSDLTRLMWGPVLSDVSVEVLCTLDSTSDACISAADIARMHGFGPMLANLMPLLLQLVLCFGLVRGRRVAWSLSLVVQLASLGFLLIQLWDLDQDGFFLYGVNLFEALLPWLFCIAVLLYSHKLFSVHESPRMLKKYAGILAIVAASCSAAWLLGTLLVKSAFVGGASLSTALAEWPLRFLPAVITLVAPHELIPANGFGWFFYEWVGNVWWLAVIWALWRCFAAPSDPQQEADRVKAREILERRSGDHLSFMTLWQGNRYFFERDSYVAYRASNGIALTLGGPVGDDISREFEDFVRTEGMTPAWYSVNADFANNHPDFKRLEVAEEAVLSCENTEFKGKKFQNIRTARNKAAKEGVTTVWTTWDELDVGVASALVALSEEWVSEKALPEMGFTLGGIEEMKVAGTRLLLAIGDDGMIHGMTSWMPVSRDGQLVGYTLDVMRRNDQGFKGVMELLISEALVIAAGEGCEWISLSGAPLAGAAQNPSTLDTLLAKIGEQMEPLYGFRSLAASKRKFQPEEHKWFLCYEDELSLPSIGLAVVHAYLPNLKASEALNALRLSNS